MQCDAEVGRKRPRGGSPDDHAGISREFASDEWEFDENRWALLVGILDFCLSQCGLGTI